MELKSYRFFLQLFKKIHFERLYSLRCQFINYQFKYYSCIIEVFEQMLILVIINMFSRGLECWTEPKGVISCVIRLRRGQGRALKALTVISNTSGHPKSAVFGQLEGVAMDVAIIKGYTRQRVSQS